MSYLARGSVRSSCHVWKPFHQGRERARERRQRENTDNPHHHRERYRPPAPAASSGVLTCDALLPSARPVHFSLVCHRPIAPPVTFPSAATRKRPSTSLPTRLPFRIYQVGCLRPFASFSPSANGGCFYQKP